MPSGDDAAFDSATIFRAKRRWFRDARKAMEELPIWTRNDVNKFWSVNVTILDDLRLAGRAPAVAVAELLRDIEND
jgi:hypothetical protein